MARLPIFTLQVKTPVLLSGRFANIALYDFIAYPILLDQIHIVPMTDTAPNRRSRFLARATRAVSTTSSLQPLHSNPSSPYGRRPLRSPSPALSDPFSSQNDHLSTMDGLDSLTPPTVPFRGDEGSRRSSVSSDKYSGMRKTRPSSLSVNYVPAKFTKLHAPGTWAHRRAKQGGGRDAFATDASRMGMMGTVDDDEGVVFQLGKGGLKKKKPRLRWNRFKLVLFFANTVVRPHHMEDDC